MKGRILFHDESYGPNAQQADMPAEDFDSKKESFLEKLKKSEKELEDLERKTVLQSDSQL